MGTKQVCVYIHTTGRKTWDNALKSLAMLTGVFVHHGSQRCSASELCDFISSKKAEVHHRQAHKTVPKCFRRFVLLCASAHVCVLPGGEGRILTLINNVGMSVYCPHPPPTHTRHPSTPTHSLLSFLSVLKAQRELSTAPPAPVFFFQESTQRTSSAFNIHHQLTASSHVRLPYRVHVVCVCIPVCA